MPAQQRKPLEASRQGTFLLWFCCGSVGSLLFHASVGCPYSAAEGKEIGAQYERADCTIWPGSVLMWPILAVPEEREKTALEGAKRNKNRENDR